MSEVIKPIDLFDHPICFTQPLRLIETSAWIEHVPFGMFIIDLLRPEILVELGTHMGVSYCAFCQAIKQVELNTRCYAVDTWEGDIQAGYYEAEVLADLRSHHDPLYGEFSRLLQNTFDDAVKYFTDGSIDLLHIDGLHTYEAVKHDFETWLPKMSNRGVVMFHDINVRERDFGVWQFWMELEQNYPHFVFYHGHGLGILYVGEDTLNPLKPITSMSAEHAKRFREFFFVLGSRLSYKAEKEHDGEVAFRASCREWSRLRRCFRHKLSNKTTRSPASTRPSLIGTARSPASTKPSPNGRSDHQPQPGRDRARRADHHPGPNDG